MSHLLLVQTCINGASSIWYPISAAKLHNFLWDNIVVLHIQKPGAVMRYTYWKQLGPSWTQIATNSNWHHQSLVKLGYPRSSTSGNISRLGQTIITIDLGASRYLYNGSPNQNYGASPAIWDHSVTCHPPQVNMPHINSSQADRYSI